jgi:hypothetical protein
MPAPGEPLFTADDTAAVVALAEEERDTCPACGMPKVWCRAPENQFAFEPSEERCHVAYRLAEHRAAKWEGMHESTRAATQLSARFRPGHEPDLEAGLGLDSEPDAS